MKQIAIAAVALILGLVLGGLGPRSDLRALEAKVATMSSGGDCTSSVGSDLAALMAAGSRRSAARNALGDRSPDVIAEENPEAAALVEEINAGEDEALGDLAQDLSEGIDSEQLELARTALELRRAQARASLVEDADPDETQLEAIDGAVNDMNSSLMGLASELTEMINNGEEPTRQDAMSFAADALDTMIIAEESMRGALDPDQLAALQDGSLDPFSYVDPELVSVLEGLGATE